MTFKTYLTTYKLKLLQKSVKNVNQSRKNKAYNIILAVSKKKV